LPTDAPCQADTRSIRLFHKGRRYMADPKGLDPFEAFKQKKKAAEKQNSEAAKNDEAAKKLGWVEGVGPADKKIDPKRPKGFSRGRYQAPPVKQDELSKLRPKKFTDHKLAKHEAVNPEEDLPPVEERRPDKFSKF
jgi:hypothetical protein